MTTQFVFVARLRVYHMTPTRPLLYNLRYIGESLHTIGLTTVSFKQHIQYYLNQNVLFLYYYNHLSTECLQKKFFPNFIGR